MGGLRSSGVETAPHPSQSNAQGQAHFTVNDDGTVNFKLMASNIDNVVQSHIHCGRFGETELIE